MSELGRRLSVELGLPEGGAFRVRGRVWGPQDTLATMRAQPGEAWWWVGPRRIPSSPSEVAEPALRLGLNWIVASVLLGATGLTPLGVGAWAGALAAAGQPSRGGRADLWVTLVGLLGAAVCWMANSGFEGLGWVAVGVGLGGLARLGVLPSAPAHDLRPCPFCGVAADGAGHAGCVRAAHAANGARAQRNADAIARSPTAMAAMAAPVAKASGVGAPVAWKLRPIRRTTEPR